MPPQAKTIYPVDHIHDHHGALIKQSELTPQQLTDNMCRDVVKKTDETNQKAQTLLEHALDARAALDVLATSWKKEWFDLMDYMDEQLKTFRMTRMAFDTEQRRLLGELRDVRQFFLDKDYETERARLKEFVEVCERLKALKESGFLDTVSDTMLRLSAPPKQAP